MELDIVKALSKPSAYPHKVREVRLIQTHISWIFLTGKYVYKVKKPVNFGFLDFTTLKKRKFYCEEEVRVNKLLAPAVYLGVVPITLNRGELRVGGRGRVVEYAVKMLQLPQELIMSKMLESGRVNVKDIEKLAKIIAQFHKKAKTTPKINHYGLPKTIAFNWNENFAQTEEYINETISREEWEEVKKRVEDFMKNNSNLFKKRVRQGKVKECHGDLHSGNIFLLRDSPVVFDAIEFNPRFRCSDVVSDVAFLTMDLEFHGHKKLAKRFVEVYKYHSKDEELSRLLSFYKCYRAYVRGKVTGFRLRELGLTKSEKEKIRKIAHSYFQLALKYARELTQFSPPMLIVIMGLPGTGKSTVARALGKRLGMKVLSTDIIRKRLASIPVYEHSYSAFGEGIYRASMSERTYSTLLHKAEKILERNKSCILDGTFSKVKYRKKARELAKKKGAKFLPVLCTCSEEVVRRRLVERKRAGKDVSDATLEIYMKMKENFDEVRGHCLILNTSKPIEDVVEDFLSSTAY